MSDSTLPPPTNLKVDSSTTGESEILTWDAPANLTVFGYWYVVTRVRKATNGVFYDSTVITPYGTYNRFYEDNDVVLHCFTYTYYVSVEARIDSSLIVESPLSTGVQAREGGARNAVVIYPISKTLVAVAGSQFYDTIYACSANDSPLTYSIIGYKPQGMNIDSMSGAITWNVPIDYVRGTTFIKVMAENSLDSEAFNVIAITVKGSYLGSIDGNITIKDTAKYVSLFLVNILSGDVDTLNVRDVTGVDFTGFSFKNAESGLYKIFVKPQPSSGAQPFWYHATNSHNVADTIHVQSDATTSLDWITVNFPQRTHVILNGTLSDSQGAITNGIVQAFAVNDFFTDQKITSRSIFPNPPTLYYAASAVTSSNGIFSIQVDSGVSYILL
ncbi:MAG TPA: hypothetical protein VFA55_09475, partial [Candidatus Kapabacteria bacterium]|nr:hypothetical protein [Candidatus Kapabacteria bacterium]